MTGSLETWEFRAFCCPACDPRMEDPDIMKGKYGALKYLMYGRKCRHCGTAVRDMNVSEDSHDAVVSQFPHRSSRENSD